MRQKVLLIDDEKDLCMLISRFLTRKNYEVVCAHTIHDGMDKLESFHPDTLLLDNNLPDGLGWKEATRIRSLYPDMKITLLSGGEATLYSVMGNGLDFPKLEKPISLSVLENYVCNS